VACFACDGVGPGGVICETEHWRVDHTIGPLGVGTLIVKPRRHVVHVGELTDAESAELGPLLQRTSAVVGELTAAEQVYVCLWSHMNAEPVHIHFVVQPATRAAMDAHDAYGPRLQLALFDEGRPRDAAAAEAFAAAARRRFVTKT
jgi:ATP adenylyltransferase